MCEEIHTSLFLLIIHFIKLITWKEDSIMAIPVKALLLERDEPLGHGLDVIRKKESEMVDITDYNDYLSDSTSASNCLIIIHNDKVYRVIKNYFDLDKHVRIYIGIECAESRDIIS